MGDNKKDIGSKYWQDGLHCSCLTLKPENYFIITYFVEISIPTKQ